MIKICSIASGSNGNCYYVSNGDESILIDVGISRKQVLERMSSKGLDASKIKAIFISHEHTDHYRGVRVLSNKLSVPVYITQKTYEKSWHPNRPKSYRFFSPGDIINVGRFKIHSFLKNHDAVEPCSFRVEHNNTNVGVLTDIGSACDNVKKHLSLCDALFLESNYDEDMLFNGTYPQHLKVRVSSDKGHLSNKDAAKLLEEYHNENLKLVLLSHLSGENNKPEIALSAFDNLKNKFKIDIAGRNSISDVYEI